MTGLPDPLPGLHLPAEQQAIRKKCFLDRAACIPFPEDATVQPITARFERVAESLPHHIALKSRTRTLTYQELDRETNGLAYHLIKRGLKSGETVGLLFENGVAAVVAQLGALKAGAIRVELDVSFPQARLRHILSHAEIRVLITTGQYLAPAEQLAGPNTEIINLDDLEPGGCETGPHLSLRPDMSVTISYTSGSTGQPKGIMRNHTNELHSVMRVTNSVGLSTQDRLIFTRCSVAMPLHALLNGATYYPEDLAHDGDLLALADWIRDEKITVYRSAVSTFRAFTRTLKDTDRFPDLRLIILQGEPVYRADVDAYRNHFSDQCILVSSLGLSELGDYAHYFIDKASSVPESTVPGGYPLTDTDIILLENTEECITANSQGEIGVQGPYVNVSAWRRPDLDVKMYCKNLKPLTYRTGDMGSLRNDGCVLHLGRKDFQIKVRGNRVDLAEVEAALLELDGIAQAAAIGHTDTHGDVQLVAYIVPDPSGIVVTEAIREILKTILPEYMIPALFVQMENLPLTLTGKLDKLSLPIPDNIRSVLETDFREPQGIIEEYIASVWKDVLRIDRIGIDDLFLELGGDSLKAMMIIARVTDGFEVDISRRTLFDMLIGAGTIGQMAGIMEKHYLQSLGQIDKQDLQHRDPDPGPGTAK
jgi:acyl-coenzyme A synthetase/AMP-(fatty) acid ligase/acyl carrier protein